MSSVTGLAITYLAEVRSSSDATWYNIGAQLGFSLAVAVAVLIFCGERCFQLCAFC